VRADSATSLALSLAIHESFVPSGTGRLYVREVGSGLPIIVVHGGPDFDHEYLLPDFDRLAEPYRLVYYDQRGRGRSFTRERPGDVTIASEVADLDAIRDWSGSDSVAVLGHSWGGLVAMEYAVRYPDRVSHLILLNTAPASHADMLEFRRALAASRSPGEVARMTALTDDPTYLSGDIDADAEYYRIHFRPALRRREHVDRVVERLRAAFRPDGIVAARAIEESLYAQTWSRADYDLIPRLRDLRVPTLVIHGDHDFVPVDIARHIASAIPGARLLVLGDCGHFAYLEQPDLVRVAMTNFLTGSS
jgi:proline iminopeptidase